MTIAQVLLRAKNIGVRNVRDTLSKLVRTKQLCVITEHGHPASVLLPYDDMLELADIMDELQDEKTIQAVLEGRKAIARGAKGIDVEEAFKQVRKK